VEKLGFEPGMKKMMRVVMMEKMNWHARNKKSEL